MADGLLQPRIGGLFHGVSRQSRLQRSPSQLQELDNFLPAVEFGGFVDRHGTRLVNALSGVNYASTGHHFFTTSDGQRWVCLRRIEYGTLEVRNVDTGVQASLAVGAYVQNYIGTQTDALRFLTLGDTTLILNTTVATAAQPVAQPELTAAYLVVRKVSSAAQTYTATSAAGTAQWALPANSNVGRDFGALWLNNQIGANMPGVTAFRVAPNVIRVTGSAAIIQSFVFTNDWDETAVLMIKGRVSALSDLPPVFEGGVPVLVALGNGDNKSSYYVQYDPAKNAWVECSYLPYNATTGSFAPNAMPIRLHQTTANGFELQPCNWVARKTGDNDSNPFADFAGRPLTAMAHWKGRLWFAAGDSVFSSQADDLFNFWRDSAREVLPADPITLPVEATEIERIEWLVGFRSKLMVMCDTAQLEIPGEQAVTPTTATMGVATRYQMDGACEPRVIGDSLYYTGKAVGRSALWEYRYEQAADNNTADDLSKHVPGYVPGHVRRIRGAAQSGRTYMWADGDPSRLYLQTSYWKDEQRQQNAWSKLTFAGVERILAHWVSADTVYIAALGSGHLLMLALPVDAGLGDDMATDYRLDYASRAQLQWNVARQRTEVMLPQGYESLGSVVILVNQGDGWWREYDATVAYDGQQFLAHFPFQTGGVTQGVIGLRYERSVTFSAFYPSLDEKTTPMGRLQVAKVHVDCMVSCDFTATVKRADRIPMVTEVSPRTIDSVPVPLIASDVTLPVPFNSQGDKAELTLTSTSTGPLCITGFTLTGRYTNTRTP
jgi:hypothetical protein